MCHKQLDITIVNNSFLCITSFLVYEILRNNTIINYHVFKYFICYELNLCMAKQDNIKKIRHIFKMSFSCHGATQI